MNFMDISQISQISDIQSVSTISHCTTGRICGRIDSLQSLFEHHCSTAFNASKSNATNSSQSVTQTDEILRCFDSCEESISDLVKSEIVFDCLTDLTADSNTSLAAGIAEKLRGILLMYELEKYMQLPLTRATLQDELTLLGITDIQKHELTCEEKLEVKFCSESLLREKLHNFILRHESTGGIVKDVLRRADCNGKKKLFETFDSQKLQWTSNMQDLCATYEADIKRYRTLTDEWIKLKYYDMHDINVNKAEHLLLSAEVILEQAKITTLSSCMRMFRETPITLDAFQMLNSFLNDKLQKVVNEAADEANLKGQYDALPDTEYSAILRPYLDICKAIRKKQQILKNF